MLKSSVNYLISCPMKLIMRFLFLASFVFCVSTLSAQIINVPGRIHSKVLDRVNNKIDRGIDKGLDAVEESAKADGKKKDKNSAGSTNAEKSGTDESGDIALEDSKKGSKHCY